jgi:hypothetical protein
MSTAPWLICIELFYGVAATTRLRELKNVSAYIDRINARPAVQNVLKVLNVLNGLKVPEHSWD